MGGLGTQGMGEMARARAVLTMKRVISSCFHGGESKDGIEGSRVYAAPHLQTHV